MTPRDDLVSKRCAGPCGETKPLTAFYRNRAKSDGRNSECRDCSLARNKAYQANLREEVGDERFKEINRDRVARYRSKPEGKKKDNQRVRAYNEALKRVRDAHKDEFAVYLAEEHKKNREASK